MEWIFRAERISVEGIVVAYVKVDCVAWRLEYFFC